MARFTFYVYVGAKHWRHPVMTITGLPCDWGKLQLLVKECAIVLWNEKNLNEALLTLEKHLGGSYTMKWRRSGYSPRRVYYKRNIEFSCKVQFNPHGEKVKMSNVSFGPDLLFAGVLEDFRRIEKGIWKRPGSVIPKAHEAIRGSTKSLLMEPSASRYGDYSRTPNLIYGGNPNQQEPHRTYDRIETRGYLPRNQQIIEDDETEDED